MNFAGGPKLRMPPVSTDPRMTTAAFSDKHGIGIGRSTFDPIPWSCLSLLNGDLNIINMINL
jgi:hypothetical protein